MLNQEEINNVSILFFITLSMLIATFSVIFTILKFQKKQIINTKNLLEIEKENELRLLKTELQVQETTFQHISREIHDNIGQKLTLAKLNLTSIKEDIPDAAMKSAVMDVMDSLTVALNDLRDLSRSMSSDMIKQNGLIKALEFEIQQINKPGRYNIKLVVTGDVPFMEADLELAIFRMVQEALSNIMKHADATQIEVAVSISKEELQIEIKDNGCGFLLSEIGEGGNGLKNISARASSLNGKSEINSIKGQGTQVIITIPIL
jgi:two-component system NarL family sensor kinase